MVQSIFRILKKSIKCNIIFWVALISTTSLMTHPSLACEVTLRWDPNTEPQKAGYMIYWGTESGQYSESVDLGDQNNYTISALDNGQTYYIAVTAYDELGFESDYSNEVHVTVVDCPE